MWVARVRFLVGDLRFHMLCGQKKKKNDRWIAPHPARMPIVALPTPGVEGRRATRLNFMMHVYYQLGAKNTVTSRQKSPSMGWWRGKQTRVGRRALVEREGLLT